MWGGRSLGAGVVEVVGHVGEQGAARLQVFDDGRILDVGA